MVEIREETDDNSSSNNNNDNHYNGASTSNASHNSTSPISLVDYVKANRSETVCFALRVATLYFAVGYFLPFSSASAQKTAYMKAFISAAATNAFRLHQRLKNSQYPVFSRVFLSELMFEDSAHYLFYCLIFAMSSAVTMALVPIILYALLHGVNFGIKLANATGNSNSPLVTKAAFIVTQQNTANILSMIACAEIAVIPIFIAMIFVGKANIFFPFIYYRFISMRYLSRRNPYTRIMLEMGNIFIGQLCTNIRKKKGELSKEFCRASLCVIFLLVNNLFYNLKATTLIGMALPFQFVAGIGLKVGIVLLTVAVLILLDPSYVTAYIAVNYEIILIYIISALTLLYCIVSMIMYGVMQKSVPESEEIRLTNCALSEIVFAGAGTICWMIVCGIGGTVAQRTIIETGQWFGWLGACAGIIACLFIGVLAIFALNIINDKILSTNRKYRYNSPDGIGNGSY